MRLFCTFLLGIMLCASPAPAADPPVRPVRYMLHGGMTPEPPTEEYLRFVEKVKPDVLIAGAFDQRLYALAAPADPKTKAKSPTEYLARWKEIADRLHKNGIRLIGHMELNVLTDRPADLKDGTGWFGYYDRLWDEKTLGKRPTKTAAELLEEPDIGGHPGRLPGIDATALCGCRVNTKALMACINKPSWREVQKRMVNAAVEIGVDGFATNRNFFGHCACDDCRRSFRGWLGDQYPAAELNERLGIADLSKHPLTCVVGQHRDHDSVPAELVLEKQRFAKHAVKEFFDEVYVRHARGLRKDLFAAQWNHMAYFDELHLDKGHLPASTRTSFAHATADERWGLPEVKWGRGESLIWYCNWGTTQTTILKKEYAGDTTLYGKYIRAMARGTPYVVNKYDYYRPRNMMAEAAALGYATNALITHWEHEEDRAVTLSYFDFLRKHEDLSRESESYAEVGLVFPRRAVHAGDASPLEYVEAAGRAMIRRHVLFDILPDDLLPKLPLSRYRVVIVAGAEYLEKAEQTTLTAYMEKGGRVLVLRASDADRARVGVAGESARKRAMTGHQLGAKVIEVSEARTNREGFLKQLDAAVGKDQLSGFDMPWTVEVHAYRQAGKRLVLHLVNYNRREDAVGKSVSAKEAPIAAEPMAIRLRLPEGVKVKTVRFHSPDDPKEYAPEFRQKDGFLEFRTSGFLVYGLCVIEEEPGRAP
ncbi:MAG: beta-galactosidase [Planctomycetes bacterium]|nr:beta-galactosidase [Planctomycetota bacterium]